MQLHILITSELNPIPEGIKIDADYGKLSIIVEDDDSPGDIRSIEGLHAIVSGAKESIINWLKPFDGVWLGDGNPMMEHFEIHHIKDEL